MWIAKCVCTYQRNCIDCIVGNVRFIVLVTLRTEAVLWKLSPVLNIEQTNPDGAAVQLMQLTCNPKHSLQPINRECTNLSCCSVSLFPQQVR